MSNLKLYINGFEIKLKRIQFPAGETLIRIEQGKTITGFDPSARIVLDYRSNSDLIDLALLVDAFRREYHYSATLILEMPYFPYARQDRVCSPGESLSAKVIADFINSMGFTKVICWNMHSDVSSALLNNCINRPMEDLTTALARKFNKQTTVLVSPDAGATKKTMAFAKRHGFQKVIYADKQRNVSTGEITGIKVNWNNIGPDQPSDFLVLDDICDGGRTFVELAKELSHIEANMSLYVTHAILSQGTEELSKYYKTVYTSNMMNDRIYMEPCNGGGFVEIV